PVPGHLPVVVARAEVALVERVLLLRGLWRSHGEREVAVAGETPPLRAPGRELRHEDAQRSAFLAARAGRTVDHEAQPPEVQVQEGVVEAGREVRGADDKEARPPSGQVGAGMLLVGLETGFLDHASERVLPPLVRGVGGDHDGRVFQRLCIQSQRCGGARTRSSITRVQAWVMRSTSASRSSLVSTSTRGPYSRRQRPSSSGYANTGRSGAPVFRCSRPRAGVVAAGTPKKSTKIRSSPVTFWSM